MKTIVISKYTTAQTAPIVSGISFLFTLLRSFPFKPAFMNVGPSQRIMAYVAEKAMPLNASDATSGSPSPWKVFATTATQARKSERRLSCSVTDSSEDVIASGSLYICRTMRLLWIGNLYMPLLPRRYVRGRRGFLSLVHARTDAGPAALRALSVEYDTPVTRGA